MHLELLRWQERVRRAASPPKARTWLARGLWWRVLHDVHAPEAADDTPGQGVAVLPTAADRQHPGA